LTVNFTSLWRAHPLNSWDNSPCLASRDGTYFGNRVRAGFPTMSNQSATRLGVALKACGVPHQKLLGVATCGVHLSSEMHFVRALELAVALSSADIPGVSPVEKLSATDVPAFYRRLYGRKGIIYLDGYWRRLTDPPGLPTGDHIDLWNGYRLPAQWLLEVLPWTARLMQQASSRQVWFWEVAS
jgi:hypothetical protein